MTAVIRSYQASDQSQVQALIATVLGEFGFSFAIGGLVADLQEIGSRYGGSNQAAFFVAELDAAIVGTVAIRPKQGRTCELKRLYVRADQRGTGLGQALYERAESFARAAGYDRIYIDSSRRFTKARRLYERNGFVLTAELSNEWEDNIYERPLT